MSKDIVEKAKKHFGQLVQSQLERVERMKVGEDWVDYSNMDTIKVGILGGDGIGPFIAVRAR